MNTHVSPSIICCLIIVFLSELAKSCELSQLLRDKWYFQHERHIRGRGHFRDHNRNTFLRIRRSVIQFRADRTHRIRYKCLENRGNIYLLRKRRFQPDKDGILCIGFSYIADNPYAEFSLVRLMSPGVTSHIMSPRLVSRGTRVTIDNACEFLHGNNNRQHTFIRRRKPGCRFPAQLQGDWNYTYRHARRLTFAQRNLTLELLNGERYLFYCDTRDNDHYVIRNSNYRDTAKDAIMCMRVSTMENPFYNFQVSRTNSGTEMDRKLKLVPRGKRVYLHVDCDWLDSPARPEFLYPL